MIDVTEAVGPGRRLPAPSRTQVMLTVAIVGVVVAAGIVVLRSHHTSSVTSAQQSRDEYMGLASMQGRPAPNVSLPDQHGQTVSLSALQQRGQAVVMEFMDSHCTDICPIVSQEFKYAYQALGAQAAQVTFVAVNVNPFHVSRADVAGFTDEQGLNQIPSWHFLTGSVPQLHKAWAAYGVAVQAPSPTVDVIHSDNIYFIDPSGHERWLAAPVEEHTAAGTAYLPIAQVRQWGIDIASVAKQTLS